MLRAAITVAFALALLPAGPLQADDRHRLEIRVERYVDGEWQEVSPERIFDQGDQVRFRVRSNFDGYLHVTNQGTSGEYKVLFPTQQAGDANRIEAGKDLVVPSTEAGSFRMSGPAGREIVYWLASPTPVEGPLRAAPERADKPDEERVPHILPRCDDTILRVRGECVDSDAGPHEHEPASEDLPRSRALTFVRHQKTAIVSAPVTLDSPLVFELRISHR